jgi:hypothetical protein
LEEKKTYKKQERPGLRVGPCKWCNKMVGEGWRKERKYTQKRKRKIPVESGCPSLCSGMIFYLAKAASSPARAPPSRTTLPLLLEWRVCTTPREYRQLAYINRMCQKQCSVGWVR